MNDEFEKFLKKKLEEGVSPSTSSLAIIEAAAKKNLAVRSIARRFRLVAGGLLAASLVAVVALTVLFGYEEVDKREIERDYQYKSISHLDNVTMEIIGLLSMNDVETQGLSQSPSDMDRLLLWQDAPYNELVNEYSLR
jgi:hypothetical protein